MSLRFVHAADLHLDSPFTGIQSVAPQNVHRTLLEATFGAYDRIIDLCIEEKVDALLVAGDVYDGADRSLKAQLRFIDGLKRLDAAGVRSFVCHGNHDALDGWQAKLRFPDSCHQFGARVEAVELDPARPGLAKVYGVSYPKREVPQSLVPGFGRASGETFSIGLLHANVGSNPAHAPYSPCTVDDLRATGINYWALGHVHTRQVVNQESPVVVYPGNPQGRHPTETGERGVYLVDVDDGGEVSLDFQDMSVVRWETAIVDATGMTEQQDLLDEADLAADRVIDAAEGRDVVYRMRLVGRTPLRGWLSRPNELEQFLQQLNERHAIRLPFAWCARVTNEVKGQVDRSSVLQQEDFTGDLLRLIVGAPSDAELKTELSDRLKDLFEHHRAGKYLNRIQPDGIPALLAEAEALCLEGLIED